MAQKSLFVSYILWLFGGWFGLHLFYLRRDRQAIVWCCTLGGLIFGWIRDLWRIPVYVAEANHAPDFMAGHTAAFAEGGKPRFKMFRFIAQVFMGYLYGSLVKFATPTSLIEEYGSIYAPFACIAIALGAHTVGNIGTEKVLLWKPFLKTLIWYIGYASIYSEEPNYLVTAVTTALTYNGNREFRELPKPDKALCKRLFAFALSIMLYTSLWGSAVYFNMTITTEDGEEVKVKDALKNFFKSPAWIEFKDTVWQLYEEAQRMGWRNVWNAFINALDPKGEKNAMKVLGVSEEATEADIRKIYKKLAVKWHPDRHSDPEKKKEAQERFIEIQQAYEVLTTRKKNSQPRPAKSDL